MAYLGIDIGGTKLAVSLSDNDGTLLETVKAATPGADPDFSAAARVILDITAGMSGRLSLDEGLRAVGLSCPGPLHKETGRITHVATAGWRDVPVRQIFKQALGIPVLLENDANCAALAEARKGAGAGYGTVVYYTVSTGIGGGICVDGKLVQGEAGLAGELGHVTVDIHGPACNCGGRGCVELYSSGTSIAARARARVEAGEASMLNGRAIDARAVESAVRAGDTLATEIWDDAMDKLGVAAAIVCQVVNPGVIVFGGGVSNAWDLMEDRIRASLRRYVYPDIYSCVSLAQAKLGGVIGTTGAILLAMEAYPAYSIPQ